MKWIVELDEFVYISSDEDDEGTNCIMCARRFDSKMAAEEALRFVREHMEFKNARILSVTR